MRAHFLLLAAAAIFLATSDVASANQAELSKVASPQSIETANIAPKRFLRTNKYELDEQEERGIGALDDVIVKAGKTKMSNAELKKLVTPKVLENALSDRNMKLFKDLYAGKVSLKRFAKVMKNNPNKEEVLKSYRWFRNYHISQAKARTAV
ncbi:hypothetical protein DVH05_018999 [Phytophthora capsici]|nr:hypothetical protein DVH05_018999 [Phytophthora capsici]|eukprot:jgi/Phyca11/15201/fgenesh1_pg.PHYCAscaffold_12_\